MQLRLLYNASQGFIPCCFDICKFKCRVSRVRVAELWIAGRCTNRQHRTTWDILTACKARILELVWSPTASLGVKLAALKFMQRVILVQTRGVSDPRVSHHTSKNNTFYADCPNSSCRKLMIPTFRCARLTIRSYPLLNSKRRGKNSWKELSLSFTRCRMCLA